MVAHCGQSYLTPYSASKGALATLTKNVANAFAAKRIRCNEILTGWMANPGGSVTQQKFHGVGEDWLVKAEAAQPMGQLVKPIFSSSDRGQCGRRANCLTILA
jgi:NAD(P)-dependent dehydrogenase (short-subunit alcohol dehydrogenase family)